MNRIHHILLTAAGTCFAVSLCFAQELRVAGTSVTMAPPPGFSTAERFSGFERADQQASIMVTELPFPVAEMRQGMTKPALAKQGMTLLASTPHKLDGRNALLLQVSQNADGVEFLKWMLVAGDQTRTVMIVGVFPRSAESDLSEPIKASPLTARLNVADTSASDHFEGLPFRVTPSETLKIAGRLNNLVILNESGTMEPRGPDAAVFAVGNSVSSVAIPDLKAFSEARAKQTVKTANLRITERRALRIGGDDAYEIVGEAVDTDTGKRVTLYQVLMPDEKGYFIMQGLIASERAAVLVPEFKRIAATFRRTRR